MAVTYGNRFPKYLSSQIHVLWWELDEVATILMCFGMAMIFGGLIWWLSLFIVPYIYSRAKKGAPKGFFKHLIYFAGLGTLDGYPTFYERNFVE